MLAFTISFSSVFAFLLGMLSGATLLALLYLLFALITIKRRSYIIDSKVKDITEQDIKDMIKKTQDKFILDSMSEEKEIKDGAFKRNISYMVVDIARKFYPDSKRPLAELTLDELLMLDRYIVDRVDEIVDRPGIRLIKRLKLNTIINITQAKKKVDNSSVVKTVEKYKIKKILGYATMALKAINPLYWFKKLVINNVINKIMQKIYLLVISIAGEETFKVYSKQAFTVQDQEFEQLVNELSEDAKEIKESAE